MPTLTGAEKKRLRGLAHGLEPVVRIGRKGLSEAVVASLDEALEHHELIKVRIAADRDAKRRTVEEIETRLGAAPAGLVGHVAIFYRPASDPEKRRIELSVSPEDSGVGSGDRTG